MAHTNPNQLSTLLNLLDNEANDIFLHIDKSSSLYNSPDFSIREPRYATLEIIPSMNLHWGGYSQINCELALLIAATKKYHQYYHLLSGMDLPIKSQDEIIDFFSKHDKHEFVNCWFTEENKQFSRELYERISFYYPLQEITPRNDDLTPRLSRLCQRILHIDRQKHRDYKFAKGSQWFSITDEFARYVLKHEKFITTNFRNTYCADEIFLQTLLINSPFFDSLYLKPEGQNLRLIDWKRGSPYVFKREDYNQIQHSNALFARKFDQSIDSEIIDLVSTLVS